MRSPRSRPYDILIPAPILDRIKDRRHSPDGVVHEVKTVVRAGRRVYNYPWSKMELGDFFIVPIGGRSKKAMRVAFQQAAARHDMEIAVKEVVLPDGSPAYRVTVVIIQVSRYKLAAVEEGITGVGLSDGRWKSRKRRWARQKYSTKSSESSSLSPKIRTTPDLNNPFWADEEDES